MLSFTRAITALALLLVISCSIYAQTRSTKVKQAPVYALGDINTAASRVYARVFKKTSLGHEHAVEGTVRSGRINLTSHLQQGQAVGEIVFDMRSFKADTSAARKYLAMGGTTSASMQQQVNANMLGRTVLDVAMYPTAVYKIEKTKPIATKSKRGLSQIELDGSFTLHGQTRPLSLLAEVEEKNGWTHMRCAFNVRQTDFGIRPFTKAFGTIGVADQLTIYGDLWVAGTISRVAQQAETQVR